MTPLMTMLAMIIAVSFQMKQKRHAGKVNPKNRNLSTSMITTMDSGGVCSRDCDAEYIGFFCCLCDDKFIKAKDVTWSGDNYLIHMSRGVEHEFCDDCKTKNFWRAMFVILCG